MSDAPQRPRRKAPKNTFTTKSGKTIKLNRTLADRMKASREARAQRKAAYLSSLPKEQWKRLLYRLHPKRLYQYWFSREGAIMALKITGVSVVVVFLLIVGLFAYFRKDLPKIQDINSGDSGGSIAYYARDGKTLLFQDFDAFKRIAVDGDQISPYMKEATIAVEDKDFYHEGAFNVKGMTRAAINNATGGNTQGGSTITQQLVKLNEGWTNDHSVSRKVKELILAVELEREYSKDEILNAYLNMAPYSGLDFGVQAAAQDMFGVDAKNLTLEQAALLASIPKSPGALSPYASAAYNPYVQPGGDYFDKEGLIGRQHYTLDNMAKQGYITKKQAEDAKSKDILAQVHQRPTDHYAGMKSGYAYAVQAAKAQLQKAFPEAVIKDGGWKVVTTIDPTLQDLANKSLSDNAKKLRDRKADNAAFVAEDNETGEIVALIGGMDFATQQVNFASEAPISPGSSIKPYSYATLINNNDNVGAGSLLYDAQGPLPGYPCTNKATPEAKNAGGNCLWDDTRKYYGPVTLRYALGSSLNVPAVKAFTSTNPKDNSKPSNDGNWRRISINTTLSTINSLMGDPKAYRCYLPGTPILQATEDDETQCDAAAGIGNEAYTTLADHVNGISSLSRLGKVMPQTMILEVTNASGKKMPLPKQAKPKQVIRQEAAYIVNNMASDPGASYLGGSCNATTCTGGMKFHRYKGWANAIKTGTNQDLDGLMMSWNTKYTAGVWIGNYDRHPYSGSPENATDPIMKQFMQGAIDSLGNVKPTNWTQPSGIKTLAAFHSAVPFRSQSQPPATDLFPSWYVGNKNTNSNTSQATDKVSGLLATSCTPTLARQDGENTATLPWNVDIYMGGSTSSNGGGGSSGASPQATDDVHSCGDHAPKVEITAINGVATGSSGTPNCPASGCTVMIHVEQGDFPFTDSDRPQFPGTLLLTADGQPVQTQAVSSSPHDFSILYKPAAGVSGSVQLQTQVSDSVLYSDTDSVTINVP